ncbi:hypothetical protein [Xenorhabdus sp. SGI246]
MNLIEIAWQQAKYHW